MSESTGGIVMDYKKAGVSIEAGYESVKLMRKNLFRAQCGRRCLRIFGGFEHFQ